MFHRNTKEFCDFGTWSKRGWCRVELWSHLLREGRSKPLMVVRSESWAQYISNWQSVFWRMFEGRLTAESDRQIISDLADSMIRRKLREMQTSPREADAQYLAALHGAFIGKSLPDMS